MNLPKPKVPLVMGMGDLPPQWDAIKDDVTAPPVPMPERKPDTFGSLMGEVVQAIRGNPKPQFKGITHVGD